MFSDANPSCVVIKVVPISLPIEMSGANFLTFRNENDTCGNFIRDENNINSNTSVHNIGTASSPVLIFHRVHHHGNKALALTLLEGRYLREYSGTNAFRKILQYCHT